MHSELPTHLLKRAFITHHKSVWWRMTGYRIRRLCVAEQSASSRMRLTSPHILNIDNKVNLMVRDQAGIEPATPRTIKDGALPTELHDH